MLELEEDVYHSRHKGQKEMHITVLPTPMGSNQAELARLRENQKRLVQALQRLFNLLERYAPSWYTENLLERYAPSWYTEEHHDTASAALSATLDTNPKRRVTFLQRKIR
jgi:hypothetical protein